MTAWHHSAACLGHDPETWTIDLERRRETDRQRERRLKKAAGICRTCPVIDRCLTAASDQLDLYTLRGGLTPEQRIAQGIQAPTPKPRKRNAPRKRKTKTTQEKP